MRAGEVIASKYRLANRLGVGGMGEVWSARHTGTDREFAIKFMHAHVAASESARQRFAREARASARINHPNIIDVFDVGELPDGVLYLVMEMLDGIPLADAFWAQPPLSVRDFVAVMLDTARALEAAHAVGIVHRDIKPANVFLHRERGSGLAYAKILDFGISKFSGNESDTLATKTGSVLGSPRYMSPEQARSAAAADHRADLWAMGVILFEGLTGNWPHEGDSFSSLVVAIATSQPVSIDAVAPHLPEDLRAIVRDCLLPLDQRMPSASELAGRLEACLQDDRLATLPLPRPQRQTSESSKVTTGGGLRVRQPSPGVAGPLHPAPGVAGPLHPAPGVAGPLHPAHAVARPPASAPGPAGYPPHIETARGLAPYAPVAHAAPDPVTNAGTSGAFPAAGTSGAFPAATGVALPPNASAASAHDALSGSISSMSVATVAYGPPDALGATPAPIAPLPPPVPQAPPARSGALPIALAALSVLAIGIGVALVATLRSPATPAPEPTVAAAAPPPDSAAAQPPVAATPPATALPPAAPSTSAAGAPNTADTASSPKAKQPAKPAAGAGARPAKSKVEQLGSGL